MHDNFSDWYLQISLPCTDEILKKRWAGVENWVTTIRSDVAALLETVRIFRKLPEKSPREPFLRTFREHDAAFAQRDNPQEHQVLAGAALVQCIDKCDMTDSEERRAAMVSGTALEASSLGAVDANRTVDEQMDKVRAGLHKLTQEQRRRRPFDNVLMTSDEEAAIKTAIAAPAPDHNQLRVSFEKAFQTLLNALNRSQIALGAAGHGLRCADEETNILWWLAGGSSKDLDKPWNAINDAAPFVAAWELADLTDVALGPQDAAALLEQALHKTKGNKNKEQALQVYVNAVPDRWAQDCVARLETRALDLAPLSLALSKRVEGSVTTWPPFFESVSGGLKAETMLAPERVARLVYSEAMLFRTLANVEA
jgi:hypothetical protein